MAAVPPTNLDLLAWFSEDEREQCGSCGERAMVTLPETLASFCLGCDAITIEGVRIDTDRQLAVPPPAA